MSYSSLSQYVDKSFKKVIWKEPQPNPNVARTKQTLTFITTDDSNKLTVHTILSTTAGIANLQSQEIGFKTCQTPRPFNIFNPY